MFSLFSSDTQQVLMFVYECFHPFFFIKNIILLYYATVLANHFMGSSFPYEIVQLFPGIWVQGNLHISYHYSTLNSTISLVSLLDHPPPPPPHSPFLLIFLQGKEGYVNKSKNSYLPHRIINSFPRISE